MISKTTRVDTLPGQQRRQASRLISLYLDPPTDELTLDEFETFALDRLQLLRSIETLRTRNVTGDDFVVKIGQQEAKYMPLRSHETAAEDLRKDQISHFILRLAYCKSEELRRWFLSFESQLFRLRLERLSDEERAQFMRSNGLQYELVSHEEKDAKRDLLFGLPNVNTLNFSELRFYKVPFTQALDLVASRSVLLSYGYAYVPTAKLVSIIVARFRMNLSKELMSAANMFQHVSADPRIGQLLKNMNKQYVGKDYSKADGVDRLTPDKVSQAAELHFPLCMRNLHDALARDHHLKHAGRLQYGLFLKGAGMKLEDALVYWQTEFTKSMPLEEFIKKHAYNIRHNYGQEGKRVDYVPKSCNKIIMGTGPGVGEHHGCPYKHFDETHLSALLTQMHIQPNDRKNILDKARTHHYGVACQLHFEATHPGYLSMPEMRADGVGNHPNGWYQASVQYYKVKNGSASSGQASGFTASSTEESKPEPDNSVPMDTAANNVDDDEL